ncbi:MAG TPA: hypothetical protein VFZ97_13055 [Acidimicrobiales bacterium]
MEVGVTHAASVSSLVGVDEVPEVVRSLITLAEPDYADLVTLQTPRAGERSAEGWARAVLEEAPVSRRNARRLWRLMGLRLGPSQSHDYIQGWKITQRGDNWIRAETSSWYASCQAVCLVEAGQVSVSLSLRYDRPLVARSVWALIAGLHQRGLPVMLRQAAKLVEADSEPHLDAS